MQKSQAIEHFGGVSKLAAKIGISRQAIHAWPETVPERWQYTLHYMSDGALPVNPRQPEDRPQ